MLFLTKKTNNKTANKMLVPLSHGEIFFTIVSRSVIFYFSHLNYLALKFIEEEKNRFQVRLGNKKPSKTAYVN
jgi:hypothetical protein